MMQAWGAMRRRPNSARGRPAEARFFMTPDDVAFAYGDTLHPGLCRNAVVCRAAYNNSQRNFENRLARWTHVLSEACLVHFWDSRVMDEIDSSGASACAMLASRTCVHYSGLARAPT